MSDARWRNSHVSSSASTASSNRTLHDSPRYVSAFIRGLSFAYEDLLCAYFYLLRETRKRIDETIEVSEGIQHISRVYYKLCAMKVVGYDNLTLGTFWPFSGSFSFLPLQKITGR
uniref:Peroxisomal membrane protein PEX16 n=1 Tax=Ascaris lumbricoides TaxID=6252 RepID=A0A0M3HHZ7_ASCLU